MRSSTRRLLPPSVRATCPKQRGLSDDRPSDRQRRHFQGAPDQNHQGRKALSIAPIREGTGERVRWWQAFVFNEFSIEEVLRLGDGDPIAVSGEFDCELCPPPGGESRVSWKITAYAVLSAKATPKQRAGREVAGASWAAP